MERNPFETSIAPVAPVVPEITSFSCSVCQQVFENSSEQRSHFKSDFHINNLRRNARGLAPVSEAEFNAATSATPLSLKTKKSTETITCGPCGKSFKTQSAYDNHCNSKKHKMIALSALARNEELPEEEFEEIKTQVMDEMDPEWELWEQVDAILSQIEDLSPEIETRVIYDIVISQREGFTDDQCPLCGCHCEDVEEHMVKDHHFRFPDSDCLVDVEGFISFLAEKVSKWHSCICCHKVFSSAQACCEHMRSTKHTHLKWLDCAYMFEPFYDYTLRYPKWVRDAAEEAFHDALEKYGDEDMADAAMDAVYSEYEKQQSAMAPVLTQDGNIRTYTGKVLVSKDTNSLILRGQKTGTLINARDNKYGWGVTQQTLEDLQRIRAEQRQMRTQYHFIQYEATMLSVSRNKLHKSDQSSCAFLTANKRF